MARARHVTNLALALVLTSIVSAVAVAAVPARPALTPAAVVAWPPSTGLVVAEVVTGGASASDEYVELYNAGTMGVDLAGLEVVYVTSTGSTITRKATWTATTSLEPGRHLLIANTAGIHAAQADATYSGGFAATGGALAIRPVGGAPIDALGWGDATSGFVEGAAAPAPAAGSSVERRPGGQGGNGQDTNDNAADVIVNATPMPENLASAPVPPPGPTPTPSASPTPTPTPVPTPTPTPVPTPSPTPVPTPSPTPVPTPTPTPEPSPTPPPTPTPTPQPTPTPTPTPPAVIAIASARALPDDTEATIEGVMTVDLGSVDGGRGGFIQDATGGIAVYLTSDAQTYPLSGTLVRLTGTIDDRFAARTIRVAPADVVTLGSAELPAPLAITTGEAGELVEGVRVAVAGTVTESPSALADGLGVTIDDGSGPVRIVIGSAALGGQIVTTGDTVEAVGPLGQRDSSGTGLEGYRVHATRPGDAVVSAPEPSPTPTVTPEPSPSPTPSVPPTPTASPTPSASPTPAPSATPTPTPAPTASPSPTPSPTDLQPSIGAARAQPIGAVILVRGTVVAENGRIGSPPLVVIADASGGLPVKVPDGTPRLTRGTLMEARGTLAAPYGQLELKVAAGALTTLGTGQVPAPRALPGAGLGESTEGQLARIDGELEGNPRRASSGDLSMTLVTADGTAVRVMADATAGVELADLRDGGRYVLTGIVGQRASRKGALDGYRLWLRDRDDITLVAAPAPTAGASATPHPSNAPSEILSISRARVLQKGTVTVDGIVTAGPALLDASGRRIVIEDATGGIEILLPSPDARMTVGRRIRVSGEVGRSYGVPRIKAASVQVLGSGGVSPRDLRRAPAAADECRLVRVSGVVLDVKRLGQKWRAEIQVGSERVVVSGLPGAGIPPDRLTEGARASVTGIVRRPYPTATDRRFAVVPRSTADIAVGPTDADPPNGTPGAASGPASGSAGATGVPATTAGPIDVDLTDLVERIGVQVRAGGLVTELTPDGFLLDDGTDIGRIVLDGDAADLQALVEPGDAVNVIGRPEARGDEVLLVVTDPAGLIRAGETDAISAADPAASAEPLASPHLAGATGPLGALGGLDDLGGPAGLAMLLLATIASAAVTVLRRLRARRVLTARLRRRLATVTATSPVTEP